MNFTLIEGEYIPCDGAVTFDPPSTDLFPQWWIKGTDEWFKARGDSLLCFCAALHGDNEGKRGLKFWTAGNLVLLQPGDYTVTVHARTGSGTTTPGGIKATANRPIHIVPRVD